MNSPEFHLGRTQMPRRTYKRLGSFFMLAARGKEHGLLMQEASRLRYAASHDELSGFMTKEVWRRGLDERIAQRKATGVFFLDFNAFKSINDTLGHLPGDKIIRDLGEYIRNNYRRDDDQLAQLFSADAGRFGGDEFSLAVNLEPDISNRASDTASQMVLAVEHLRGILDTFITQQPDTIRNLGFGIAMGGALYDPSNPDGPKDSHHLLLLADEAMLADKRTQHGGR